MKNTIMTAIACAILAIVMTGCGSPDLEATLQRAATTEIVGKLGISTFDQRHFETTVDIDKVETGSSSGQKALTVCFKSRYDSSALTAPDTPYDRLGACKSSAATWYSHDGEIRAAVLKLADDVAKDLLDQVAKGSPKPQPSPSSSPAPQKTKA